MSKLTSEKFLGKRGVRRFYKEGVAAGKTEYGTGVLLRGEKLAVETSAGRGGMAIAQNMPDATNETITPPSTLPTSEVTTPFDPNKAIPDNFAELNRKRVKELRGQVKSSKEAQEVLGKQPGLKCENAKNAIGFLEKNSGRRNVWNMIKDGTANIIKSTKGTMTKMNGVWANISPGQRLLILGIITGATLPFAISGSATAVTLFGANALSQGGLAGLGLTGSAGVFTKAFLMGLLGGGAAGFVSESINLVKGNRDKPKPPMEQTPAPASRTRETAVVSSPETETSGMEARVDRAVAFVESAEVKDISINIPGNGVFTISKLLGDEFYIVNSARDIHKKVSKEDFREFLKQNPEILEQILTESVKFVQVKLNNLEALNNERYLLFSSPYGNIKLPLSLNVEFSQYGNIIQSMLKLAGLDIPSPSLRTENYGVTNTSMYSYTQKYGEFKFNGVENKQLSTETTVRQVETAEQEERLKIVNDALDALDTLVEKLKGDITIDLGGDEKLTFRADNGNLFLVGKDGKDIPLTSKNRDRVVEFIAGEPGRVKALEGSVKALSQSPESPKTEAPKTVNELLKAISAETSTTTATTETASTTPESQSPEAKSEFGLDTVEAVKNYVGLKAEIDQILGDPNNKLNQRLSQHRSDLAELFPNQNKQQELLLKALGLPPNTSPEEAEKIRDISVALAGVNGSPENGFPFLEDAIDSMSYENAQKIVLETLGFSKMEDIKDLTTLDLAKSMIGQVRGIAENSKVAEFMVAMSNMREAVNKVKPEFVAEETLKILMNQKNEEPVGSMLKVVAENNPELKNVFSDGINPMDALKQPNQISNIDKAYKTHQLIQEILKQLGIEYQIPNTIVNLNEANSAIKNGKEIKSELEKIKYLSELPKGSKVAVIVGGTMYMGGLEVNTGESGDITSYGLSSGSSAPITFTPEQIGYRNTTVIPLTPITASTAEASSATATTTPAPAAV